MTCTCDPDVYCACLSGACRCIPGFCECIMRKHNPHIPLPDRTPIGDQHVIPGAEKATDATMAQRRANAPLRPTRIQLPIGGLFNDTHTQTDLIDAIRRG